MQEKGHLLKLLKEEDACSIIDFDNCRFVDEHTDSIRWHKQCYASYCSERNIQVAVRVQVLKQQLT